jgi:hypothetical protein
MSFVNNLQKKILQIRKNFCGADSYYEILIMLCSLTPGSASHYLFQDVFLLKGLRQCLAIMKIVSIEQTSVRNKAVTRMTLMNMPVLFQTKILHRHVQNLETFKEKLKMPTNSPH